MGNSAVFYQKQPRKRLNIVTIQRFLSKYSCTARKLIDKKIREKFSISELDDPISTLRNILADSLSKARAGACTKDALHESSPNLVKSKISFYKNKIQLIQFAYSGLAQESPSQIDSQVTGKLNLQVPC